MGNVSQGFNRGPPPAPPGFLPLGSKKCEDIAIFACLIDANRASELMEGFSDMLRKLAQTTVQESSKLNLRSIAQGKFGIQNGYGSHLLNLFSNCDPRMMREIFSRLPLYCRSAFIESEHLKLRPDDLPHPSLEAFARRLILETTH